MSKLKSRLGRITNDITSNNVTSSQVRSVISEKQILNDLQSYGALLSILKTRNCEEMLEFSLHNRFAIILMNKYGVFIKEEEKQDVTVVDPPEASDGMNFEAEAFVPTGMQGVEES